MLVDAIRTPTDGGLTVADLNEIIAKLDKPRSCVGHDARDGAFYLFVDDNNRHHLATMDEVQLKLFLGAAWVGEVTPTWVDSYTLVGDYRTVDPTLAQVGGLTADEIAKAVQDEGARRLAGK